MNIIFLGTKGEIEESSKKHKYHSSTLITYKNFKLLVDYGEIQKYSLEKIKPDAILITHAHPDHYVWTLKENKTKIPVYLTKETLDYGKFKPKNYIIIKSNKKFRINGLSILPYKVLHSIKCPAVGFKIFAGKKKIIYTGDLVDMEKRNKILKDADYYIGDGSSVRANLVRRKDNQKIGRAHV